VPEELLQQRREYDRHRVRESELEDRPLLPRPAIAGAKRHKNAGLKPAKAVEPKAM